MDYSQTVNLPKTEFPMKADLPKREPEWLKRWEVERVYEQSLRRRASQKGKKQFILHDGPPYANGHLHLGHALNKILKDFIVRSKSMAGYFAPYVPGWDCHGLPIELQLMKDFKIDKHHIDRQKFRQQAADYAAKFVDIQRQEFQRMGVLGDWEHPYLTMSERYKAVIVECFEKLEKSGYVYRGNKPVYWCSNDETALAEAEVEYENDTGPSIYVAFPVHHVLSNVAVNPTMPSVDFLGSELVIWTTTPWTLPANRAVAMKSDDEYVMLKTGSRKLIVAAARLESFQKDCGIAGEVIDRFPGHMLRSLTATNPFGKNVNVFAAPFVAMDSGTGLVHIAPGHGREDYQLGAQHDLEVYSPLDDRGRFTADVPQWQGLHVFKANPLIIEFLREKNLLLWSGEITHSYPHCWRCHKPVIFRATPQWFLNIDHKDLRARCLQMIEEIDRQKGWIPAYGKNRIAGMVEARPDWCLSRQRFWGTEIPGGHDIFDVWFESGVSWAAVLKERPELSYPADMYLEGSDQHRGWFQTSLIPSVALENQAPFKSVLTHGFVMDGQGRPMSKSLGNVIKPEEIIKEYGADVLRLWVASSDYGGDVRLSKEILKGAADAYRKVRNTLRYLLNNLFDFDPVKHRVPLKDLPEIDRWALHRLDEETRDALGAYERYEFYRVVARLVQFCGSDLSAFYLDAIKDRLYCDPAASATRRAAQTVLYALADRLIRLWAPVLAFTMDEAWRFLGHTENVALADFPAMDSSAMDAALMERWTTLLGLREQVLAEIEKARAAGTVKAPREIKVIAGTKDSALATLLRTYEAQLPVIWGVSQTVLENEASTERFGVRIEKADGQKCARCWIHKTDVGAEPRWPDVCSRCAKALDNLGAPPAVVA